MKKEQKDRAGTNVSTEEMVLLQSKKQKGHSDGKKAVISLPSLLTTPSPNCSREAAGSLL